MMKKPVFTADELYLIERTFDESYSVIGARATKAMELISFGRKDIPEKLAKAMREQVLRLVESESRYRAISNKCESARLGK